MRILKLLGGFVAFVAAAMLAGSVISSVSWLSALNPFDTEVVDRSGPTMLERIRDLEEFTAAEANFIQDVDIETDVDNVPGPLAGERVVAIVAGSVSASVDLGGLDEGSVEVDDASDTIRLELPDPVLGDVDIDESQTRIIDRDRGLWNRLEDVFAENPTDDAPIYAEARERLHEAAEESELLQRGRANTETWLTTFLGAAGFETVEVSWS